MLRADRLSVVFNYAQIVRSRKSQYRIHIARKPVEMHSDNRASPGRHAAREIGSIEVISIRPNVREDRLGAERADGAARCHKCERRDQYFVTGLNAASAK